MYPFTCKNCAGIFYRQNYAPHCSVKCFILKNSKIDPLTKCSNWIGSINGSDPRACFHNKKVSPARLLYAEQYGPINKDHVIIKTCGNELCVNIEHLTKGTKKDFALAITKTKGRTRKIQPDQIPHIITLHTQWKWPHTHIAKEYGVSDNCIRKIINKYQSVDITTIPLIESEEEFMKLFEE